MRQLLYFLSLLFLSLTFGAFAAECEEPEGSSAWAGCMSFNELVVVKNKLNVTYKKLLPRIAKSGVGKSKEKLVASQKAWITYRNQECLFVQEQSAGANKAPSIDCQIDMTKDRTAYLERLLET